MGFTGFLVDLCDFGCFTLRFWGILCEFWGVLGFWRIFGDFGFLFGIPVLLDCVGWVRIWAWVSVFGLLTLVVLDGFLGIYCALSLHWNFCCDLLGF